MTDRPNIILIMTDQQRFDTIGAWGADHMITPNMDRLVNEGISFRQAYCPGATCIATRAAMFTGMYPHNTGTYSFDLWAHHRNWVQDLADAGYFCANIGKMHFSPRDDFAGFHERVIVENPTNTTHWNGDADDDWGRFLQLNGLERPNHRQDTDPDWLKKYQAVPWHYEERYHSDVFIGDSAVAWINNHRSDCPIFLQVGFTGPHEPWDPLPRHLELYEDVDVPGAIKRDGEWDDNPPQHRAHNKRFIETNGEARIDLLGATDEEIANMRRHYYANITTVDEKLGEVLEALENRGYLENSLIIFCSDHGEMLGDHGHPYKWLMYDAVVHVPMIVCHPGVVEKGDNDKLVSLMDIGPTILEAAGIEVPTYLEGRSLMPVLKGERESIRDYVFCEDNYLTMIRSETQKLVYYTGQEEGEFYDLESDPHELDNRWSDPDYADAKNAMLLKLLEWISSSAYHTGGYKQGKRHYKTRWVTETNKELHGQIDDDASPITLG